MNKTRREIECLNRLHTLNPTFDDMFAFLFQENLISREYIKEAKASPDIGKVLQGKLTELSKESKFQLLEYEWTILPVERIKILIITDRNQKSFDWNF